MLLPGLLSETSIDDDPNFLRDRRIRMDADSSFELIQAAQGGDSEALGRLLQRYLPALRRWAHGRLPSYARDMSDTQDLVQEAVTRTLLNFKKFEYRGDGALQAYLSQAVMNRIRDEARRISRKPVHDDLNDNLQDEGRSPLEAAIGTQTIDRYEAALASLDPADREAVVARLELGCSYEEIAALVGKPTPDAARMAVARAIKRLANVMSRQERARGSEA
jgi:RNA polymerase sigma-70 factor (ECF subfamily)